MTGITSIIVIITEETESIAHEDRQPEFAVIVRQAVRMAWGAVFGILGGVQLIKFDKRAFDRRASVFAPIRAHKGSGSREQRLAGIQDSSTLCDLKMSRLLEAKSDL